MNYVASNIQKLKAAQTRIKAAADEAIKGAYISWLANAYQLAMDIHESDPVHHTHIKSPGSYGWVIIHRNREVERRIYNGVRNPEWNFVAWMNSELDDIVQKSRVDGWLGVMVICMAGKFDWDFEEGVVHAVMDMNGKNFPMIVHRKFMKA